MLGISILGIQDFFAEERNFQISVSIGRSLIFAEFDKNENSVQLVEDTKRFRNDNYNSFNYGLTMKLNNHLLDLNYKDFKNNNPIKEDYFTDEITRKEFHDYSLKYGQQIDLYKGFTFNAFAGIGYISRRIDRSRTSNPSLLTTTDEFITFPLKMTLEKYLIKRIGLNGTFFYNLNFEEIIYGFEINLLLRVY